MANKKASTSRKGSNRGNIAEGIVGAAIVARLQSPPNTTINEEDVDRIFEELRTNGKRKRVSKKSYQRVYETKSFDGDRLTFTLALTSKNIKALFSGKAKEKYPRTYKSSLKFVNEYLSQYTDTFITDKKKSHLEIIADGVSRTQETKSDVTIIKDGKEIVLPLSIKAGESARQFGQSYGQTFDKQEKLWGEGFGLDLGSLESEYNDIVSQGDPTNPEEINAALENAVGYVYEEVALNLKSWLVGDKDKKEVDTLERISDVLSLHLTKNDPSIVVLKMSRGKYNLLQPKTSKNILDRLAKKIDLDVHFQRSSDAQRPMVVFYDRNQQERKKGNPGTSWGKPKEVDSSAVLFQVRFKVDGTKRRNLLEMGPMMIKLFSVETETKEESMDKEKIQEEIEIVVNLPETDYIWGESLDAAFFTAMVERLTMPIQNFAAFKAGLIDRNGKIIREPKTRAERRALTALDRMALFMRQAMGGRVAAIWNLYRQAKMDKDFIQAAARSKSLRFTKYYDIKNFVFHRFDPEPITGGRGPTQTSPGQPLG